MSHLSRLRLLFWTVRYLEHRQILARILRLTRRRWWSIRRRQAPSPSDWQTVSFTPLYEGLRYLPDTSDCPELAQALERARQISLGRFSFLNRKVDLGLDPDWQDTSLSRLWRYHLHYFDYVQDLLVWKSAEGGHEAYDVFRSLATSWMKGNSRVEGDGWHPYTLSLRITNWIHALGGFRAELQADPDFGARFVRSLAGQALVLSGDLEFDVRGNHLLENIRALLWTGMAFDGKLPSRWYGWCLALLERELEEQILPDGSHFERSPGYHLRALQVCLETAVMINRNRGSVPPWLDEAIHRMLDYLLAIVCPDGQVPLLKDTALDAVLSPESLLTAGAFHLADHRYLRSRDGGLYPLLIFRKDTHRMEGKQPADALRKGPGMFRGAGYFVLRDDSLGDYMIVDGGKPCPDYLPAHAHADMLSFELSVCGRRVIVDSGVFEYAAGPWRDYFRSTGAHNTVEVAKANQSEVYGSFRLGRRARPAPNHLIQGGDWVLYQGGHDGYMRLRTPVAHRRTIVWVYDRFWLVLDELRGLGECCAASHIHLHPTMSLEEREPTLWRVGAENLAVWIRVAGHQRIEIASGQMSPRRQGWYSDRFGHIDENTVLSLGCVSPVPFCFGYAIFKRSAGVLELTDRTGERIVSVIHERRVWALRIPELGVPSLE